MRALSLLKEWDYSMIMQELQNYFGKSNIGIFATYTQTGQLSSGVGRIAIQGDNSLRMFLENCFQLRSGQAITVHLDNRSGIEEYDAELKVYRSSYKGVIHAVEPGIVDIAPVHYEVTYGISVVHAFSAEGYSHPSIVMGAPEPMPSVPALPWNPNREDGYNQVGVLVTNAPQRPHTTLMAFHAIEDDRILLVTWKSTLKYALLSANPSVHFAIDNRNTFTFEEHPRFNFTLLNMEVRRVPDDAPERSDLIDRFVQKNPFEQGFFLSPEAVLLYLEPKGLVHPQFSPSW